MRLTLATHLIVDVPTCAMRRTCSVAYMKEWEGVHLVRCTLYFCRLRVYANRVRLPTDYANCPSDMVRLPDYASCLGDRVCLPYYAGCPGDWVRLPPSSVTCPIPFNSRGKIDPGYASHYITLLLHAHVPGPLDSWKEFPLSARDLLFDMFTETYDKTMADRYVEGTPQPDFDPEAWVNVAGGPRKGRVYGFRDSLDTTPVLSSYASLVAPPAYASSSTATPGSGGEDIRTLIREELSQQLPLHLSAMVEQLVAAIRGAGPSQKAPQYFFFFFRSSARSAPFLSTSQLGLDHHIPLDVISGRLEACRL
ncbi:hypothetical protein Taro_018753 [Colocasia esculenta]|uniref:Uncharacterized protein n=1 Tax=Colocasia esculenta TaxID=4460 RepID=A0A843UUR0_COLES|nr:hypothetical protein [Colocasia esculenta]